MDHQASRTGTPAILLLAMLIIGLLPVEAAAGKLKVRFYDIKQYEEHGKIRFVVDARRDGAPLDNLAKETWTLEAAGHPLESVVDVTKFRSKNRPASVLVILPATPNFTGVEELEKDKARQKPIQYVLEAVSSLKTSLGPSDLVSIHCYNESRREPVSLDQNKKASRLPIPSIESIKARCGSDSPDAAAGQPRLQTLLLGSIQKWLSKRHGSVHRFVVVVFTDGDSKEVIQEKWFRSITKRFSLTEGWIELYVVGLEDGGDSANLQKLAREGILGLAAVRQNIPDELMRLAPLISGDGLYNLDYLIEDSVEGPSVTFTVGVDGSGGQASGTCTIANVERKTSWLSVVLLIVGILVGLLILIVIIRLIVSAVAARRLRRRDEAEALAASQPYDGPSRGHIIVRDGPATGQTFHLIADMTYLGRSPENEICLPDSSVGKRHASIRIKDRSYLLEDLQSVNGVFVNGQRVLKANLKDGDSIRIGSTEMQFSL